jgi:hypothetical protein
VTGANTNDWNSRIPWQIKPVALMIPEIIGPNSGRCRQLADNGWAKRIEGVLGKGLMVQETVMNCNGSSSRLGFNLLAEEVPSGTRLLVDEKTSTMTTWKHSGETKRQTLSLIFEHWEFVTTRLCWVGGGRSDSGGRIVGGALTFRRVGGSQESGSSDGGDLKWRDSSRSRLDQLL